VAGLIERLERRFTEEVLEHPRQLYRQANLQFCADYRARGRIDLNDSRLAVCNGGAFHYPLELPVIARLASLPMDSWQIEAADMAILTKIVRVTRPKRVLEFGPGRSTLLFLANCCEVDSMEYDPAAFDRERALFDGLSGVRLHRHGRPILAPLPHTRYDLALVDGPSSRLYADHTRLDAMRFALERSDLVLLHDAKRPGEKQTIETLARAGYMVEIVDTPRGMAIVRRPAKQP
jgi:predicted O-methyltransferase YrrM